MDILLISERKALIESLSTGLMADYEVKMVSNSNDIGDALEFLSPEVNWFDLCFLDVACIQDGDIFTLNVLADMNINTGIPVVLLVTEANVEKGRQLFAEFGDLLLVESEFESVLKIQLPVLKRWSIRAKRLATFGEQLNKSSLLDSLTQLPNVRSFEQDLVRTWCQLKREKQPLGILVIDLDHFNLYNQTYGKEAADETLRVVALLIEGSLSRPMDSIARLGEDLFAVLLPNTDSEGALKVAQVVMRHIREAELPFADSPSGKTLSITMAAVSFGYDYLQSENTTALMELAKHKLSKVKEKGRNRVDAFVIEKSES